MHLFVVLCCLFLAAATANTFHFDHKICGENIGYGAGILISLCECVLGDTDEHIGQCGYNEICSMKEHGSIDTFCMLAKVQGDTDEQECKTRMTNACELPMAEQPAFCSTFSGFHGFCIV